MDKVNILDFILGDMGKLEEREGGASAVTAVLSLPTRTCAPPAAAPASAPSAPSPQLCAAVGPGVRVTVVCGVKGVSPAAKGAERRLPGLRATAPAFS